MNPRDQHTRELAAREAAEAVATLARTPGSLLNALLVSASKLANRHPAPARLQ